MCDDLSWMVARSHLRRERRIQTTKIVPRNFPGQCEFSGSFLGFFWVFSGLILGVYNLLSRIGFGAGEWTRTTDLLITNEWTGEVLSLLYSMS